jgi:protein SCO1/2
MNRRSLSAALALGVAVVAASPTAMRADERAQRGVQNASPAPTSASIYNLDSKWTTQDGVDVSLASFAGKPVVAAMGYTTCRDICPAIVIDMMWIEKHLPPSDAGRVRFAFFSFDSEADTPERLRLYAESHGLDLNRWTLLRADADAARELAAALGVGYRPNGEGGFDHVAVISLLDEKGEIVFQQRGARASPDELLARLRDLLLAHN